ncbi:small nuclear ribonucleoprotein G [Hyalella azteca]|uniref:Small nuclear ribonucleoprotein G n=2 Tax=Hyalella azteca TaxID=294128 RepID=A0A8B7NM56_HYAAZ|nr:small nuclear ribonucleoprotein G [Hyalella azteca]
MSSKAHPPELKKYMDKQVKAKLNGGRIVEGVLRGFDPFLNLVVENCVEIKKTGEKVQIGSVVMRGSSIVMLEALDRIS